MYQVISIFNGHFRSEGFYEDLRSAVEFRGWLAERLFNCPDGVDKFEVIVQKIDDDDF